MSNRWHVNPQTGKVGSCSADIRSCPFGEEAHFASQEEAAAHSEWVVKSSLVKEMEISLNKDIQNALKGIKLVRKPGDGRPQSLDDEKQIIDQLVASWPKDSEFRIQEEEARKFSDITFIHREQNYPFYTNIKTSDFSKGAADNLSSQKGMAYAVSGKLTKTEAPRADEINELMAEPAYYDTSDYYLLAVDKGTNRVYFTSLLKLPKLTPNGSNLPFQIAWKHNLQPNNLTRREAIDHVRKTFEESQLKKSQQLSDSVIALAAEKRLSYEALKEILRRKESGE